MQKRHKHRFSFMVFLRSFFRVFKFAFKNIYRNKGFALAALLMMIIFLGTVTSLIFFQELAKYLISQLRERIDITAYFKEDTPEEEILKIRDELLKMFPEVRAISYISKEEALLFFRQRHQGSEILEKALREIGENPFLPSLNIITGGDPSQYEEISKMLESSSFAKFIQKVDFSQKKEVIEKVYSFTQLITRIGSVIGIILVIISLLVVFNTIKLAVDVSKDEIEIMKMVGASRWFIRGPFVIEGIVYGIIAALFCFGISWIAVYFTSPFFSVISGGFNFWAYLLNHWQLIILIQMGLGVTLGTISGFLVIKKYL